MQNQAKQNDALSDDSLQQLIEAELLEDDRVSANNITVHVNEHVATLEGAVASFRRKLAAQKIVSGYDGIREVRNELCVEPAAAVPDDEVAEAVRNCLDSSADLVKETVTVEVSGGKVTLTGTVATVYERLTAEDIARGIRGVRDVVNMLNVNHAHRIDDHELMNGVQAALSRSGGLKHCDVHAAIAEDTVVLSGTVQNAWQREVAETVVGRFRFSRVRNEIQVYHPE